LAKDLNILANNNQFIKRPNEKDQGEFDEVQGHQYVKNIWKPYQQKFFFKYNRESSEE
jgi:N-formylglutamate amidohydrolase